MRLGQLARQLDIKTEKIVLFLEKEKNVTVKSHPNSKVPDELIEIVTTHFTPVVNEEKVTVSKIETPKEVKEEAKEIVTPTHIETVKAAPAQELKIIGKIDLPNKKEIKVEVDGVVYDQETIDSKKKEELAADRERKLAEKKAKAKEAEEKKAKAKEKRAIEAERQAMLETEKNNLLSKEEEKKKAEALQIEQERLRKLEIKRKKQQKEHYTKKHSSAKTKQANKKLKKNNTVEEKINTQTKHKEVEKLSAFQKFIKWLNT